MSRTDAPVSKLVEQATSKADLSYSYWAAKNAHSTATPDPKLLTQEEVARQMSEIDRLKQTTGASAWNMGGTFEERAVGMEWVKASLGELLRSTSVSVGGSTLCVAAISSCTGEAHQWLVRGRKRAGFELEVDLALTQDGEARGKLCLTQISSDDLEEMQLAYRSEGPGLSPSAVHSAFHPTLLAAFKDLLERIKAR
ncbi:hypothetical protein ACKKBG_A03045 [Auxenochlorella protothecoides x Auxenochlorella symbiontica]